MKFVLWGVVGFLVVMWVLRAKKIPPQSSRGSGDTESRQRSVEAIVQCRQCGLHIPLSEAIVSQSNAVFCSEAHRSQHISG